MAVRSDFYEQSTSKNTSDDSNVKYTFVLNLVGYHPTGVRGGTQLASQVLATRQSMTVAYLLGQK